MQPERLFDVVQTALDEVDTLTPDRRRTINQRMLLRRGIHPLTRRNLLEPRGRTCGDCDHHVQHGRYHKCDLNQTMGAGTDIRVSWPACELFKPSSAPGGQ